MILVLPRIAFWIESAVRDCGETMAFIRFVTVIFLIFSAGCTSVVPEKNPSQQALTPVWANKSVRVIEEPGRLLFVGLATEAGNEEDVKRLALLNSVELLADHLELKGFSVSDEAWLDSGESPLVLVYAGGERTIEITDFMQIDIYTECENVLGKRIYKVFVLTAVPKPEIERLKGEIKPGKSNDREGEKEEDAK